MQFILEWVNCAQRNRPLGDEGNKNKKREAANQDRQTLPLETRGFRHYKPEAC